MFPWRTPATQLQFYVNSNHFPGCSSALKFNASTFQEQKRFMETLLGSSLGTATETLGVLFVHFVWQGTVLAGFLAVALMATRFSSASVRHALACITLVLMLLAPLATLQWMGVPEPIARLASEAPKGSAPHNLVLSLSEYSLPFGSSSSLDLAGSQWMSGIGLAWLLGIAGFSLRWAGAWRQVRRLKTVDVHPVGSEFLERFEKLRVRIGVGIRVQFKESARVHGPMVIGWLRPVILIPTGLLTGMPMSQVESLILHELAHIRGNDALINWICRSAETILFFHPAVWWVTGQIQSERENRCDDVVRETMGEGRTLAEALLTLCERQEEVPVVVLAAGGGSLAHRIRRLIEVERTPEGMSRPNRWRLPIVLVLLVVMGFLIAPSVRRQLLYKATAKVRFEQTDGQLLTAMIHSNSLLKSVVDGIGLDEAWQLTPDQCVQKLAPRIRIKRYRMTSLFEIICADESPQMAATIANRCAESLSDILRFQRPRLAHQTVEARSKRVRQLEGLVEEERERIAQSTKAGRTPSTKRYEMLDEMLLQEQRREVEEMLRLADMPETPMEVIQGAEAETRRVFW